MLAVSADFPPSADFSLADLEQLTGEVQANLLYLEKKFGLLSPVTEQRGRRQVRRYTLSDLRKALFVTAVKKIGKSVAESVAMRDAMGRKVMVSTSEFQSRGCASRQPRYGSC